MNIGNDNSPMADNSVRSGVTPDSPIKADTRGIEAKLVKALENAMDRQSFDTAGFAYLISLLPTHIQKTFMQSFLVYTDMQRHKLATDTYADGEYDLCITAMRIQEGLDRYPH
jgi:hypothetical protein